MEAFSELLGFTKSAEQVLSEIEKDAPSEIKKFNSVCNEFFTLRSTAQQLGLSQLGHIASLGEEIAAKALHTEKSAQIRKCLGSLWDALTTIKFMVEHSVDEVTEEKKILINRLENTLENLGGARTQLNQAEIDTILRNRKSS